MHSVHKNFVFTYFDLNKSTNHTIIPHTKKIIAIANEEYLNDVYPP